MERMRASNVMTPVVMAAVESPCSILVMTPTAVQADVYYMRIVEIANRRLVPIEYASRQGTLMLENTSTIHVMPESMVGRARGMRFHAVVFAGSWEEGRYKRAEYKIQESLVMA